MKPTQRQRLIDLLSDGRWHPVQELHGICWRYGARLWEMRKEGLWLEKRRQEANRLEEWRLVTEPQGILCYE